MTDKHQARLDADADLRDQFAGQAMAAIISKSPFLRDPDDWEFYEKTAIGAYDYADAMLKAREEQPDAGQRKKEEARDE